MIAAHSTTTATGEHGRDMSGLHLAGPESAQVEAPEQPKPDCLL